MAITRTTAPALRPATTRRAPTYLMVTVLSLCGTSVALTQTLVVPLLPDFPRLLHTSASNASWLITATLLASAVGTPIAGRVADMFGKRLVMLVSLGCLVAGSLTAAAGGTFGWVLAGRALQGVSAALIPVGISIMRDELPRERVGSAVALMSATLGIGAATGLPLSGVIAEHADWRVLFVVSGAIGLVMAAVVALVVPESPVRSRGRFDFAGAALFAVALTALLLAVSKGAEWGWTSRITLSLFGTAAVLLAVWVPFELRVRDPLVDIRTSARRPVLLTNVASLLLGFAMFVNMLVLTQLLQMPTATGYGFGLTVVEAGLAMLPGGLVMVLLSPVSAAVTRRYGGRTTLILGALVIAAGYGLSLGFVHQVWQVVVAATVVTAGAAISYAAMPTLIMRAVPITETAAANGLNTLVRSVGTASASAAVVAILTSTTMQLGTATLPALTAFHRSHLVAGFAALVAAAVAGALPGRSAPALLPQPVPATSAASNLDR